MKVPSVVGDDTVLYYVPLPAPEPNATGQPPTTAYALVAATKEAGTAVLTAVFSIERDHGVRLDVAVTAKTCSSIGIASSPRKKALAEGCELSAALADSLVNSLASKSPAQPIHGGGSRQHLPQ